MSGTYQSRKETPWDGLVRNPMQDFIRTNYLETWNQKHLRLANTNEADLINSYVPKKCPYCGSALITRKGINAQGIQRYLCKSCLRRFLPTTGTIFDEHKIPIKDWIDYSLNILRYVSINADSWNNRNDFKTSRYWLQKTFLVLDSYQSSIMLLNRVWLDETYYSLRSGDIVRKSSGAKPRGISRNKMCIGVACDKERIVCIYEGQGKPTQKRTYEAFKEHIQPCAVLVHDAEKAHKKLIDKLTLIDEKYNARSLKGIPDKDNPLNRVNQTHARLKSFLRAHSSFIRDELQNYLNLFAFAMNPPENELAKVEILLDLALSNPKLLRYRDFYRRK